MKYGGENVNLKLPDGRWSVRSAGRATETENLVWTVFKEAEHGRYARLAAATPLPARPPACVVGRKRTVYVIAALPSG